MTNERRPLIPQQEGHFEISHQSSHLPLHRDCARNGTATSELVALPSDSGLDECSLELSGATVFQTSLNIAKLCMGTGTLALPFAAQKGGLVFNMIGLGIIVVWNYYSADCLLRCLDYLPRTNEEQINNMCNNIECFKMQPEENRKLYGATGDFDETRTQNASCTLSHSPPEGTTKYGIIAWHAFGKPGLVVLDLVMILLFVGLLTSYEAAMMSFIDSINQSTGRRGYDKIIPSIAVAVLSWADDLSFLSSFSVVGLLALALAFG
eukprot:CCRYP_000635-RA/>CCRYP_000635-RA protein AED:0.02 eAED:0.02 QI:161/1/1/1/1/0.66/3/916/264